MKYVDDGAGKMPLISLIAILAISLTVNLPGLAVTPMLSTLQAKFHSSEFEAQLLTVLPNLMIIPFMLISGRLSTKVSQSLLVTIGLVIYLVAGIWYMFAESMTMLIIISAVLGVGCGFVVPLAGGLLGQYFTGGSRVKYLGYKSGVSNFTIILGTYFVGLVANSNWHLPFLVYLMPIIPLCLVPFLTDKYIDAHRIPAEPVEPAAKVDADEAKGHRTQTAIAAVKAKQPPAKPKEISDIQKVNLDFSPKQCTKLLWGIIIIYFTLTYTTQAISDYMPFTFEHYDLSDSQTGTATSLFFLTCTIAGFSLSKLIKLIGSNIMLLGAMILILTLFGFGLFHTYWFYLVCVAVMGFAYGFMQPIIYDKACSAEIIKETLANLSRKPNINGTKTSFWMKFGTAHVRQLPFIWSQSQWADMKQKEEEDFVPDALDGRWNRVKMFME